MPYNLQACTCKSLQKNSGWMIRQVGRPPLCPECRKLSYELQALRRRHRQQTFRQSLKQHVRMIFGCKSSWQLIENYAQYYTLVVPR